MKLVAPIRAELQRRTIFNILGPLSNPANVKHQLVGVFSKELVDVFAQALKNLGCSHAVVAHGSGLDELTTTGENHALELKNGEINKLKIDLKELNIKPATLKDIQGGDAKSNAKITLEILNGGKNAKRDIVLLNSAVALMASDEVKNIRDGLLLAQESINTGKAKKKLDELIEFSNRK